jgi:hypothetical protein
MEKLKWAENCIIKMFGGAGVVKHGKSSKLNSCGIPMVFVGYAKNHSADCS